jgi:hypothetical protein
MHALVGAKGAAIHRPKSPSSRRYQCLGDVFPGRSVQGGIDAERNIILPGWHWRQMNVPLAERIPEGREIGSGHVQAHNMRAVGDALDAKGGVRV